MGKNLKGKSTIPEPQRRDRQIWLREKLGLNDIKNVMKINDKW